MKLIENNLTYLKEENFFTDIIEHGFLTRLHGTSIKPFNSLNLSYKVGDIENSVNNNYNLVKKEFNIDSDFYLTNQVHSANIYILKDEKPSDLKLIEADAIITNKIDKPIGIHTADCIPLLLFDVKNKVIGAVHAGWRGALNNIASLTIKAMKETYNSQGEYICALIGPHNKNCCLEFDIDFANDMNKEYDCSEFLINKSDKKHFNIEAKIVKDLLSMNVSAENIQSTNECTSCMKDRYFSYRKDNQKTGRQLSFIMLKG